MIKGEMEMIEVTRLDNSTMVVNEEKIQSLQATPDTVITFTNNMKMVVREAVDEISRKILKYHRLVHAVDSDSICECN
jgi:flagellar protein FlbD